MLASNLSFRPQITSLETERLVIRIDTEIEYVRAFQTRSDESLKEHFGITSDDQLLVQKAKVAGGLTTYRTSVVFFHLIEKGHRKVVGSFAFHNWYPEHRRSEIGYAMTTDEYKNNGYMREAFSSIIAYGFDAMDINRMEAHIHPQNIPSRKLVVRAGFQEEGLLHERYVNDGVIGDSIVYALLRREYYADRGSFVTG